MNMENLQALKAAKNDDILRSTIDYMNYEPEDGDDFDCGYTQEDIDACASILDRYIDNLAVSRQDEIQIMACIKNVVLALNDLNERCEYSLIETDQREYLCPFIEAAAIAAGLPRPEDDITGEWREW